MAKLESAYQRELIKAIEALGGHIVNGIYTKRGEADLQGSIPITFSFGRLQIGCALEIKTPKALNKVLKGLDESYSIRDRSKLKPHEVLQAIKLKRLRESGIIALFCSDFTQVQDYIKDNLDNLIKPVN